MDRRRLVAVWLLAALAGQLMLSPGSPPAIAAAPVSDAVPATAQSALARAKQLGQPVEVLAERTEAAQTFARPDGSFVIDESLRPRFVRQPGGGWRDADPTLRRTADGGVEPVATTMGMRFSGGGDGAMAAITDGADGRKLGFTWPGTLPQPQLDGAVARYRNVLPGVDLEIHAEVDAFTHLLVIRSPKAAANPALRTIRLGVQASGLRLQKNPATGAVAALDAAGAEVFAGPTPTMWDSRGAGEQPSGERPPTEPRRAGVDVTVGETALTLVPDQAMLGGEGVTWPVVIDPTWSKVTGARSAWTVLRKSEPGRSFYNATSVGSNDSTRGLVRAGFSNWESPTVTDRSLFDMNIGAVRYKHIYKATFSLTQAWAGAGCGYTGRPAVNLRVLNQSFGSGTVWNTGWNTSGSGWGATIASSTTIRRYGETCSPRRVEFNVTSRVTQLAAAGAYHMYLGLRAANESDKYAWKRYKLDASVSIEYNTKPNAPSSLKLANKACASGAGRPFSTIATPAFTGYAKDPDVVQQSLRTRFYWWRSGTSRGGDYVETTSANPGNPTSPAIPAAKALLDGQTYVWQAQTLDDVNDSQWSGTCEITVDLTDPAATPGVTSTEYPVYNNDPNSPGFGGVGAAGTFRIAASPSTDRAAFAYTFDTAIAREGAPRVALKADGTADVVFTPIAAKVYTMRVWAVDKAGRYSIAYDYRFKVKLGNGPAARWSYDDSANLGADSSGQANTLTLGTAGVTTTPGRGGVGTAMALNASATAYATRTAVTYPHPTTGAATTVVPNQRFSISAWVKLNATGGAFQNAVSYNGNRLHSVRIGYDGAGNRWGLRTVGSDTDNAAGCSYYSTATPVAGVWTHLAATFDNDANTIQFYVNGQPYTSGTTTCAPHTTAGSWDIGRLKLNGVFTEPWNGAIDDVRIYPYAAPQAEFVEQARPLSPRVSFPSATQVPVGGSVQVRFDSGGDKNVTSFKYSVNGGGLGQSVAAGPNGDATVNVTAPAIGELRVFAAAVYGGSGNLQGPSQSAAIPVIGLPSISGTVYDTTTGAPAAGAVVSLDPGGHTTTANASGVYTISSVPSGTYTLSASVGEQCPRVFHTEITITETRTENLHLTPAPDFYGYTCVSPVPGFVFQPADAAVLPLTGDNVVTAVTLPFSFPFYGVGRTTAWVDTNGHLAFADPQGSHPLTDNIPAPAQPNAMVAPFWDDLIVDTAASVRTATAGSAGARQFIVEWRNVYRAVMPSERITFEVILDEQGLILFHYASLDSTGEQGAQATVGIESPGGEIGIEYSYQAPVLANGKAIAFLPPMLTMANLIQTFAVSGTVTDAATGTPAAGVNVTLEPTGRTAVTTSTGAYSFGNLESGSYTVFASIGSRCAKVADVDVYVAGATTTNLAVQSLTDAFGYACTEGAQPWVTVTAPGRSNMEFGELVTAATPFPVKLYGSTYTQAWVSQYGVVTFVNPGEFPGMDFSEIPSPTASGRFNAAVYAFWEELVVDSQASIHTQTFGSAPNRQWVIEWRNVVFQADPAARLSFQAVFAEGGDISLAYKDIDPANPYERGLTATVGIEDITGTMAYQYSYNETRIAGGQSVLFRVANQAPGSVSGTVSCEGAPVAGATVKAGASTTTTAADGSYLLASVPAGPYSVIATLTGTCRGSATSQVQVSGGRSTVAAFTRTATPAGAGYTLVEQAMPWTTVDQTRIWDRDDIPDESSAQVTFPFPVTLYGQTHNSGWVHMNGFVTFETPPTTTWNPSSLPLPADQFNPDAAVYPLWHDWDLNIFDGTVTHETFGTAPNRQFVISWNDVEFWVNPNMRVSFQVIFYETGGFAFAYNPATTALELGGDSTIGIENGDGSVALQYAFMHPALRPGLGVRFYPPTS